MPFEVKKNIKNTLFQSHPKFESLSQLLCPMFGPLYIVGKERFHKNINEYDFELCRNVSRCKNVGEIQGEYQRNTEKQVKIHEKPDFLHFLPSCPNQLQRCLAFGWVLLGILRRI